jgi:hypothetical protein
MTAVAWASSWRSRFGLAEICGTLAAVAGFGFGLRRGWQVPAAAGLATAAEAAAFYAPVAAKAALRAWRATGHLTGWPRAIGAAWHAVRDQFASAAFAEIVDDLLVRPAAMTAGAWIGRPGGLLWLWAGFLAGKGLADAAWYAVEAHTRGLLARLPRRYRPRHAGPPDWNLRAAVACYSVAALLLAAAYIYAYQMPT